MNAAWDTSNESGEAKEDQGSIPTEAVEECGAGWGAPIIGWLGAVEEEVSKNVNDKVIGALNVIGEEQNEKKMKRIDFCFDSGAAKTILRPKDVNSKNIVRTKDTGRNFRAANGGLIPNLGAVKVKGKALNQEKMAVVAQVADVTKPLASAMEIVQADNVVMLTKKGGMIKKMDDEQVRQLEEWLKKEKGCEIPISMKENQFRWM